jgi:hypothetical protein
VGDLSLIQEEDDLGVSTAGSMHFIGPLGRVWCSRLIVVRITSEWGPMPGSYPDILDASIIHVVFDESLASAP